MWPQCPVVVRKESRIASSCSATTRLTVLFLPRLPSEAIRPSHAPNCGKSVMVVRQAYLALCALPGKAAGMSSGYDHSTGQAFSATLFWARISPGVFHFQAHL